MQTIPSRMRAAARSDVAAFEELTRALVGITLRSLDELGGSVSVPQFRLLLAMDDLGRLPSSTLAAAAGLAASSVTRLVDKLVAGGLAERGTDQRSRSIVTVDITAAGRELVGAGPHRRHTMLASVRRPGPG